ncbi:MAG: ATP-binding protein [Pseudomonadota bacterium]
MPDRNVERVLNALSVAVFVVDADQRIQFNNAAAVSLFGPGPRGRMLASYVPNKRCIRAVEEVIDGRSSASVSVTLQLAVPTTFRMTATHLSPLPDQDELPGVVVSFEDVSHVLEARQMRSDFVANVSHELRSPLTTLGGIIETLQGHARYDPDATTRFLDLMETESQRMARIIDDLLSLSKLQSVERYAPTDPVDLPPVIEGVAALLGPILESEKVTLQLEFAPDLRTVFGDVHELGQVFRNLIENAAKYSRNGSVVRVEGRNDKRDPQNLHVTVTDQGDGIAPEHISRLTERFYRIDKGRSRDKGGTGLGLAIVKHILMRHRGRLQIDSEVGKGSAFTVILPIAVAQED